MQVCSDREEQKKPSLLLLPSCSERAKRMGGGDNHPSPVGWETKNATSTHRTSSSTSSSTSIITGGPIYRLCAQQLKPPSGKMGITGLRGQILGTKPLAKLQLQMVSTLVLTVASNTVAHTDIFTLFITANAAELMLHKNTDNIDRTRHHSLLVRRSEKGYKAVVLGQRRLRLEGPEGHSVTQALELLLELTAELLEEVAEVWEYEGYEGEEVRIFDDGSRIAVKNE